jgi:cell division protein FtsL
MIRIGPLLWLGLIALASIGTFQLKYRVQAQEQELTRVDRQIQHDRDEVQLLRAEWAHLNDPNRLSDLARRHLDLAPVAGVQVVRFDILPARPAPSDGAEPADPIATLLSQIGGGENQK